MKRPDRILTNIARTHLCIPTLKTRRSDSLDFYDRAVWQIRSALKAAFEAGMQAGIAGATIPPSERASDLPSRFDTYEIHAIKVYGTGRRRHCEQVDDLMADFWSLFGHIPGQGLHCIGDFPMREQAEEVFARITGRRYADATNVTTNGDS